MKFDKDSASKKQKDLTGKKVNKKVGLTFVKALLICLMAVIVIGGCAGFGIMKGLIDSAPDISDLSVAPSEAATYIYDMDNNPVQKLTAATANRTLVSIDQIPEHLQHAVVAVEDERFYTHNGIDIRGIGRAFVVGVTSGTFSEGASTITQQLLKNNVFTDWTKESSLTQKFKRKFQEQYLALELEKKMPKEQILEDYLNTINLGAGAYGVQAAAHRYFNKDVSELTLSESTVIAGITQNPTQFNPIIYPEQNAKRREWVLNHMLEQEYISQQEYDEVIADDVYARIQTNNAETGETSIYSYYVDALIDQVLDDLQEQLGITEQKAERMVYREGLKIYSAQDERIQKISDEEFANPENYPAGTQVGLDYALSIRDASGQLTHYGNKELREYFNTPNELMFPDEAAGRSATEEFKNSVLKSGDEIEGERLYIMPQPQASVVVMDQATGLVKAVVGGRGKKEASLTLNRATDSPRQPGSTFKVITTYAPAIDRAGMSLATVYDNAPYAYSNGVEVRNWDSYNSYTGLTTIRTAIANSINIVAVKCLTEITPRMGFEYAQKFGITTLHDDENSDVRQPLALGGIYTGVTNLELTGAYAAIANHGQFNEPKFYSRIEDQNGNVIIDNEPVSTTVIKESTAFLLTSAMQDVINGGTGTQIDLGDMPAAGKTGTTSDYNDIWFSGYTPYYTASVWGGYDNHDDLPSDDKYHNYHKILWNAIMNRIHEGMPVKEFEQPETIETAEICKKSGKLAVSGICTGDPRGSQVITEYFAKGTAPTQKCDVHEAVSVCSETGLKASATCKAVTRIFIKRPSGSEGTTEDSQYAAPRGACPGHTIVEKIKDLFSDKDEKMPEVDGGDPPRAEEDGDAPGGSSAAPGNDMAPGGEAAPGGDTPTAEEPIDIE